MKKSKNVKLTGYSQFAGCGAKLGPALLDKALCGLSQPDFPELIVDYSTSDDAGVYKITDDIALVQTVDFFPPIVDDSFTFGQIAAANALSDVYAMGGRPITALSIVGFPSTKLSTDVLSRIMEGALDRLKEAGAALVGGHSIQDKEVKFGLAVTGLVHPERILKNNNPSPGDVLILTKALGTGIINTALKAGKASKDSIAAAEKSMIRLNKDAAQISAEFSPSACTDVTGFGLIGHLCEMLNGSGCSASLDFSQIPLLAGTEEYARKGFIPGGTARNMEYRSAFVNDFVKISKLQRQILFDPQTSGGLLISVQEGSAETLLSKLIDAGLEAGIIGSISSGDFQITVH
jgi:selenide,water dikinase